MVSTGEIQSTNRLDVQKSIYGIGALLNSLECGATASPNMCITLFKKNSATLSVVRLQPVTPQEVASSIDQDVAGSVTLKYIVSLSPLYIDNTTSLKYFAS